jgi:hypothetical protein
MPTVVAQSSGETVPPTADVRPAPRTLDPSLNIHAVI